MTLSPREIATLIWFTIFVVWVLRNKSVRESVAGLLKLMFSGILLRVLLLTLLYIAGCVAVTAWAGIWTPDNLKTTLLWVLTFALAALYQANRIDEDKAYFGKVLRETLGLTVFITFLADSYTFGIFAELIIVPVMTVIVTLQAVAGMKPEHAPVAKLLGWVMTLLGAAYLIYIGLRIADDYMELASVANLREFLVPLQLSLMFMPWLFALSIYATYERIFSALRFGVKDDRLRRYARRRAILAFRTNLDLLKRWRRQVFVDRPGSREDIDAIIRQVKKVYREERDPPPVPLEIGWSPYRAKEFLAALGFESEDYHPSFDGWRCASKSRGAGSKFTLNEVRYSIEGQEGVATVLELHLEVWEEEGGEETEARFWQAIPHLLAHAVGNRIPEAIITEIEQNRQVDATFGHWTISLTYEQHDGHVAHYERNLTIAVAQRFAGVA